MVSLGVIFFFFPPPPGVFFARFGGFFLFFFFVCCVGWVGFFGVFFLVLVGFFFLGFYFLFLFVCWFFFGGVGCVVFFLFLFFVVGVVGFWVFCGGWWCFFGGGCVFCSNAIKRFRCLSLLLIWAVFYPIFSSPLPLPSISACRLTVLGSPLLNSYIPRHRVPEATMSMTIPDVKPTCAPPPPFFFGFFGLTKDWVFRRSKKADFPPFFHFTFCACL